MSQSIQITDSTESRLLDHHFFSSGVRLGHIISYQLIDTLFYTNSVCHTQFS